MMMPPHILIYIIYSDRVQCHVMEAQGTDMHIDDECSPQQVQPAMYDSHHGTVDGTVEARPQLLTTAFEILCH